MIDSGRHPNRSNLQYLGEISPFYMVPLDLNSAGEITINHPGNFFSLGGSYDGQLNVMFNTRANIGSNDEALVLQAGDYVECDFESVRVSWAPNLGKIARVYIATNARIVTGNRVPKNWVSNQGDSSNVAGSIAGLAAGASTTVGFNMGFSWYDKELAYVTIYHQGPSAGGTAQIVSQQSLSFVAPDPASNNNIFLPLYFSGSTNSGAALALVPNQQNTFVVRPATRQLHVRVTNTDGVNAFGAGAYVGLTFK